MLLQSDDSSLHNRSDDGPLRIDLQNEYLTPEGNFPIPNPESLVANITQLVSQFRSKENSRLFWIQATYPPHDPDKGSHLPFDALNGRHTSKKSCCLEGTTGVEFAPGVSKLIEPNTDVVLTKTWYSAFKETELEAMLRERGVEEVYVAGLMSNVCVLSTASESRRLGFRTCVVEECLCYTRRESHQRALKTMRDLGVHIVSSVASLANATPPATASIPTLWFDTKLARYDGAL